MDGFAMLGGLTLVALLDGNIGVADVCFAIVAFLAFAVTHTQGPGINPRVGDDFPALVGRMGTAFVITAVPAALAGDSVQALRRLTVVAATAILLIPIGRASSYSIVRSARTHRYVQEPTLIIGAGEVGAQIAAILRDHPDYGMRPIGFLSVVGTRGARGSRAAAPPRPPTGRRRS
jgi:hypothetical protein